MSIVNIEGLRRRAKTKIPRIFFDYLDAVEIRLAEIERSVERVELNEGVEWRSCHGDEGTLVDLAATHGHYHASAWSGKLPIADLQSIWGVLGCSCWAI